MHRPPPSRRPCGSWWRTGSRRRSPAARPTRNRSPPSRSSIRRRRGRLRPSSPSRIRARRPSASWQRPSAASASPSPSPGGGADQGGLRERGFPHQAAQHGRWPRAGAQGRRQQPRRGAGGGPRREGPGGPRPGGSRCGFGGLRRHAAGGQDPGRGFRRHLGGPAKAAQASRTLTASPSRPCPPPPRNDGRLPPPSQPVGAGASSPPRHPAPAPA